MAYTDVLLTLFGLALVLGLIVALLVAVWRIARRDLGNFFERRRTERERKAMAATLQDARVDVHSIQLFDYEFDYGDGDVQEATCFEIEATITPAERHAIAGWRPFRIDLVPADYWSDADEATVRSRVVNQNAWTKPEDADLVINGPARLKLVVELDPTTTCARFEYFGEQFGPEILLALDDEPDVMVSRTRERGAAWRLWASPKLREATLTAAGVLVGAVLYYFLY
jgi:hypothetical protein